MSMFDIEKISREDGISFGNLMFSGPANSLNALNWLKVV